MRILQCVLIAPFLCLSGCGVAYEDKIPPAPAASTPSNATPPAPAPAKADDAALMLRLNLNTASEPEFLTIPDVTPKLCHEFDEYRPYVSIRQFRREIGRYVSADQVAALEKYLYVPVAFNDCDGETLQQLPGIDAAKADTLTEGRPYTSRAAFLEALAVHVSDEELAVAAHYLAE